MTNQEDVAKQISFLNKERIDIKIQKNNIVKSQKYEEAARIRDREKQVESEILMLLSAKFGIDFTVEASLKRDVLKVLDLSCGDEVELIESITSTHRSDLRRETIERLLLMKIIEQYKQGQISISQVNEAVIVCFDNLKQDIRQKISKIFAGE